MAKQAGLFKIQGKAEGVSFYRSKTGGFLQRVINTGMSERVKNDPAYANTRLNAAEFGGAGKLSGMLVSSVSQRWRFILKSTATGQLTKKIQIAMQTDTTHPWGQRVLPLAQMEDIERFYNELSKNPMPQEIVNSFEGANFNNSTVEFENEVFTPDTVNTLLSRGAEGVIVSYYLFRVGVPQYDPASGKYVAPSRVAFRLLHTEDNEIAAEGQITGDWSAECESRGVTYPPQNATNVLGGVLCIMTPYKVVSNQKYILQELCSAYWSPIKDAE